MASGQATNAPFYGSVSLGDLNRISGQQYQTTNAIQSSGVTFNEIAFPPPSGDGVYLFVLTRKPYRNDNVTTCNDNGWLWGLLETRTNSSGGCYVHWMNIWGSAWGKNESIGMAASTTSGRTIYMNDTVPAGNTYYLWWAAGGGTDSPFAWQGCMVKLSN